MKIRLTRVKGGSSLRTDSVEGNAEYPPRLGYPFVLTAPPLDPEGSLRVVKTSEVVNPNMPNGCFATESGSIYKIEILDQRSN